MAVTQALTTPPQTWTLTVLIKISTRLDTKTCKERFWIRRKTRKIIVHLTPPPAVFTKHSTPNQKPETLYIHPHPDIKK